MFGGIPEIDPNLRVPIGKAAYRRHGDDITIVAWGRAVWTALKAAEELEKQGIQSEVIDLRTLVPPDLDTVYESVERTGRLLVAAEDRAFAGFTRAIQGAVVEKYPGIPSKALGQKNIPGIAQSILLEDATILTKEDIVNAGQEIMETTPSATRAGWAWIPPRYFVS